MNRSVAQTTSTAQRITTRIRTTSQKSDEVNQTVSEMIVRAASITEAIQQIAEELEMIREIQRP